MVAKCMLCLIAGVALSPAASGQNTLWTIPVPSDPLEMATGQIRPPAGRAQRTETLRLLDRARDAYALRSAGRGYDLKVSFTVNSGGQTEYDGVWKMEDVFDPKQGLWWTAKASAAYTITRISANGMLYSEETASYVPLRLHEARAALFDPIPSRRNAAQAAIRTSNAVFNGVQLTCILSSVSGNAANTAGGRLWEETEDCIDPKSGLLRVHSQVPGRYYAYDYSDSLQLAGHVMPRRVTVTEAGRTVTEISVDSVTELPAADPALFVPTEAMKARGPASVLGPEQKIPVALPTSQTGAAPHAICVFGLVTSSGQLVETHSLQPSDPYSQAAVDAARQMNFAVPLPGARPEQHFAFIIEKVAGSR
jgi:hypothetical protein